MDGIAYVTTLTLIAVMIMGVYLFVAIRIGNSIIRQQMKQGASRKSSVMLEEEKKRNSEWRVSPKLNMDVSRWDDYDRLHSVESPVSDHYSFYFDSSLNGNEERMFNYRSETWVDEYMSVKKMIEEESLR